MSNFYVEIDAPTVDGKSQPWFPMEMEVKDVNCNNSDLSICVESFKKSMALWADKILSSSNIDHIIKIDDDLIDRYGIPHGFTIGIRIPKEKEFVYIRGMIEK